MREIKDHLRVKRKKLDKATSWKYTYIKMLNFACFECGQLVGQRVRICPILYKPLCKKCKKEACLKWGQRLKYDILNTEDLKREFKVSDNWIKRNSTNLKLLGAPLVDGRINNKITYFFLANEAF